MDRFGARSLDEVLASIAVPGTDPEAVSEYVVGRLNAGRRRSRMLVAMAAILVLLAGGTAFALTGGEDPDEVVAPATASSDGASEEDSGSEVPEAGTGSVVTAVPTTVPTTIPLSTTFPSIAGVNSDLRTYAGSGGGSGAAPAPGPGAPTAPPTTGTTVPIDSPLTAGAVVVTAGRVGDVVGVSVQWSDPDLPEGTVASARVVGTGGGALASAPLVTTDGACTGGTGADGTVTGALRFAKAGAHKVTVEISTCGGATSSFPADVTIDPADGLAIQVNVPSSVNPESGTWSFTPSEGDGAGTPVVIRNDDRSDAVADNDPAVRHYVNGMPATVLVVPDAIAGPGTISHSSGSCTVAPAVVGYTC